MWFRFFDALIAWRVIVFGILLILIGCGLYVAPAELPFVDAIWPERESLAVDALPDTGENQQIIFTTWPGHSPKEVDDQITYPLSSALLGLARVKTVRASSAFGFSSIYVVFEDDVDFYWSRSRLLEKLASLQKGLLPSGVSPTLGPDATALGQVYWYTLESHSDDGANVNAWDLDELRSIQDWQVRQALSSVSGVAEVTSIGGFVQELQIEVDPQALFSTGLSIVDIADALRKENTDIGARTIEINQVEYIVRSLAAYEKPEDIESILLRDKDGSQLKLADVADVSLGPALRRGVLDDAGAEVVGGVVVARFGTNPREVLKSIRNKVRQIQPSLPSRTLDDGRNAKVRIVPFYDRAELIDQTVDTLSSALVQQILITTIVVLLLLSSLRSAFLIGALLPLALLLTFVGMKIFGVEANIMALAGIAIAIGTMVDMAIVMVEHMKTHQDHGRLHTSLARAAADVAPAILTALLTTVISFLPVFALTASEGKLFTPLAYTKSFTLISACVLSFVALPPLAFFIARQRTKQTNVVLFICALLVSIGLVFYSTWIGIAATLVVGLVAGASFRRQAWFRRVAIGVVVLFAFIALGHTWSPLSGGSAPVTDILFIGTFTLVLLAFFWLFERQYSRVLAWLLCHSRVGLTVFVVIVFAGMLTWRGVGIFAPLVPSSISSSAVAKSLQSTFPGLRSEFMPPFDEGAFLFMPTTMPHASIGEIKRMLSEVDARIAAIPEVDRVIGKAGRVDSPLDPAPLSMFETIVTYHNEYRIDESGRRHRQWRDHIRSADDIWREIVRVTEMPGLTSAPKLMPINTRILMLQSGMRAPLGVKVFASDQQTLTNALHALETETRKLKTLRSQSVFAEQVVAKPYLDITIKRDALARYGLRVRDVQDTLSYALGGEALDEMDIGRARVRVALRYPRELRNDPQSIRSILIKNQAGAFVPLSNVASISFQAGPQMLKSEDTFLVGYLTAEPADGISEEEAAASIQDFLDHKRSANSVRQGVSFEVSGTFQNQVRAERRLTLLVPLSLMIILLLLYFHFRSIALVAIVASSVLLCASGGFVLLWVYGVEDLFNFSIGAVNIASLFRLGTVNLSIAVWVGFIAVVGIATDDGVVMMSNLERRWANLGSVRIDEIRAHVVEAARARVRPCLMTSATTILALLPVVMSSGRGSDVMIAMAIPSIGGASMLLFSLFSVPMFYAELKIQKEKRRLRNDLLQGKK